MSMIVEKRVASWLGGPHGGMGHLGVDYVIVNSISNITASGTISTTFVGLILLLIIRNATKYIIVVIVAFKDKISLVINVAIRSSI
jgi:calcium/proton exchanger cax